MKIKTFFLQRFHFFKESKCQKSRAICSTKAIGIAYATQLFLGYFVCFEQLKYIGFHKVNNIEQNTLKMTYFC